jgi:glycosyltransferase involved in cell wall biosynthesis
MERKNPIAAIASFQKAFGDRPDTRMIVKLANADLFPEGDRRLRAAAMGAQNVIFIDRTMQPYELSQLYTEADCLLSLHRSEGFGLVVAEAMLHGVPALTTDWSGTTDFVSTKTGHPVAYRLVSARDPQGTYDYPDLLWAEADTAVAAGMLQELRENADGLGERARDDALRRFSGEAYVSAVGSFFAAKNGAILAGAGS